jgi:hypothetical protein
MLYAGAGDDFGAGSSASSKANRSLVALSDTFGYRPPRIKRARRSSRSRATTSRRV